MDIDDSPEEAFFRAAVQEFLRTHEHELSKANHPDPRPEEVEEFRATQRALFHGGLVGATWPKEYGGRDASAIEQIIIGQELAAFGVPPLIGQIGLGMCGPTIIVHGTDAQKDAYLSGLLDATHVWSQLFSEPGAGSDLAGISTRAQRVQDGWVLNGQKVWSTGAQYSDYGIVLTRTNPDVPKHRGLTMFIIDMKAPGVSIRPLRQMNGESSFNEVFLDGVRVPDENLLGPVDGGWGVALTTLMNERMAIGGGGADLGMSIEQLVAAVAKSLPEEDPVAQGTIRDELGRLYTLALACRYTGYRRLTALSRGQAPGPEASAGKVAGTALAKDVVRLAMSLRGPDAAFAADADGNGDLPYLEAILPGLSIAGGATEILKNVLGERVLGLPGEPRVDKLAIPKGA